MPDHERDTRPEVVLMCGVAGSGKTTFARRLEAAGHIRLSVDAELWATAGRYGIDYPAADYAELSGAADLRLRARLIELVRAGSDVVLDRSMWSRASRDEYKTLIETHGGRWRLVYLPVPRAELQRRLEIRSHRFDADAAFPIGTALLDTFLAGFEDPCEEGEEIVAWTPVE